MYDLLSFQMEEEAVIEAKKRCINAIEMVNSIPSSTNITVSSKQFLTRLSLSQLSHISFIPPPLHTNLNIGHLEALLHILHQPFISGVSRLSTNLSHPQSHINLICTVHNIPTWFIVSTRNPNHHLLPSFSSKIHNLLAASSSPPPPLLPHSIVFFFSKGIHPTLLLQMQHQFHASPFLPYISTPHYPLAVALEVKPYNICRNSMDSVEKVPKLPEFLKDARFDGICASFDGFLSRMKTTCGDLLSETVVNFDTTALVAVVSGISNGGWKKVVERGEEEMRRRFKGNVGFVVEQAEWENRKGLHEELQEGVRGKVGIVCESAKVEFLKLVEMYGGMGERWRSARLLESLVGVKDSPSVRVMGLGISRRIGVKNKVVFGTGDYWHATTLTSNTAFIRAVFQTGLPLGFIEHRPRALTGD